MLLGGGMSLTTAPATGAVMESMPLAKAGVGSAVNDTTREVGGALGVAILGSILASGYRSNLDLDSCPPSARPRPPRHPRGGRLGARRSPRTRRSRPDPVRQQITDSARTAFTDAMAPVFWCRGGGPCSPPCSS